MKGPAQHLAGREMTFISSMPPSHNHPSTLAQFNFISGAFTTETPGQDVWGHLGAGAACKAEESWGCSGEAARL